MILLTGATGFVGKNFVLEYSKKAPLRIFVRQSSDIRLFRSNPMISIYYGSLIYGTGLDEALKNVEAVVHCAARVSGRNFAEFYQTNVVATMNLLNAMKKNKVNRLLFVSSQAAAGPSSRDSISDGARAAHPVSFYGRTKKIAEKFVASTGIAYTIIRPCSVYGPFDTEILKIIKLLRHGICPVIGRNEKYVNLIYIKDLISLMLKIVEESHFRQKTYYVSDGICYQYDEIIKTICQILHKPRVIKVHFPESVAFIFGLLNDLFLSEKKRIIGFDKVREMSQDFWVCQVSNIFEEVKWKPEYSLFKGMTETIKWYRDNSYLRLR